MYVGFLRFSYFVFLFFIAQERDRNKDLCYFLKAFGTCRYSKLQKLTTMYLSLLGVLNIFTIIY